MGDGVIRERGPGSCERMVFRPVLLTSAALLALAGGAMAVRAQNAQQRGSIHGVVRSTAGDRIPYAVVVLEPGAARRFTDDSGTFVFPGLAPGSYQLRARQVGYKPFDTTVVVSGDSALDVPVSLEHLVIQLEEIRVVARGSRPGRCTAPGPPDPAVAPEAAAVFDQLRQNAERYWLLADSYPAIYRMERRFGHPDYYNHGVTVDRTDTIELRTDARWLYAPGRVLTDVPAPHGGYELQVNLPGLPDFADSTFLGNHCFRLAGVEKMNGRSYVRLDFRAADAIREPDADGSALLDPDSYLIRFVRVRLTRPERAAAGLEGLEATVAFREVVPSLVLPDHISSRQGQYVRSVVEESVEEQRTVSVSFVRALPTQRP
jgi:hypothetical protein